ncbi:serum paraoxonase/arylesterase 1-like [Mizuhopecten yessoensis]|uniref:Paraoxonase n=1 Tax=Mizuhopecten yessoensis TaxID=6573 RepID=A0A210Q2T7_MIZYE|nr:serum paraoxonase/arylesterase 1-like [Mizuhopecten yessoensis]OWF43068.1 Tripartite motif-containing protein 3 [Mizuhopecten yessoensis]
MQWMTMLRTIITIGVLSVIANHAVRYYFFMHYEKYDVIARHAPGPCVPLDGADDGSEDLTILSSGLTFISSGIYPNKRGRILLLDMNEPSPTVTEAQITGDHLDLATFSPHGIDTWTNLDTGEITLMVINHTPDHERVEVFRYRKESKTLVHFKSITSQLWGNINDLVMTGENSFYVTKILHSFRPWLRLLEHKLMLALGEVMFYDGVSVRSVAGGLHLPNGINMSPDGRFLYVSEGGRYQVKSCEILEDNEIKCIEDIFLDTSLDNIEVDKLTGDLWIGCHPRYHQIVKHDAKYGGTITPSQVLKLATSGGHFTDVVEVYLDPGTKMAGSTVASIYNERMLVGTLASQLTLCDVIYTD